MVVKRSERVVPGAQQVRATAGEGPTSRVVQPRKFGSALETAPASKSTVRTHTRDGLELQQQQSSAGLGSVPGVLESRDLERALLAGQPPPLSSATTGRNVCVPPLSSKRGPGGEELERDSLAPRRVTGVLSVAELERSLQGSAVCEPPSSQLAPPEPAPVLAREPAAVSNPWSSRPSSGAGRDLLPWKSEPSQAGASSAAFTRHQPSSVYESAFPSWTTTDRGMYVSAGPSNKELTGHRRVMKPHEIERIRYLHQRTLQLAESGDSQQAETFYARALAHKYHSKTNRFDSTLRCAQAAADTSAGHGERTGPSLTSQQAVHAGAGAARTNRRHAPNAAALASALGAPPKWTPRAPRQVLTLAHESDSGSWPNADFSDPTQSVLEPLQEDPRIKARGRIEQAFDLMHELALDIGVDQIDNELFASLSEEKQATLRDALAALLGLSEQPSPTSGAGLLRNATHPQLFYSICAIPKGKRLLCQVWPMLSPDDRQQALRLFFSRLAAFCNADLETTANQQAAEPFWNTIRRAMTQSSSLDDLAVLLDAFRTGHARSRVMTQVALSSREGASLLRMLFTQAFKLQQQASNASPESVSWTQASTAFTEWVTRHLGDAFDLASPQAATELWEMIALVDALVEPTQQTLLRSTLRALIEQGRAPQPSASDSKVDEHTASSTQ
ncbi:hypothetical protein F1559_001909 [Cyanidiococcus yangmingshanensis]|uniref:Uncharacterized protein n=1 Tax=Cyanidiococcus yangmingshanensis TaxID=2690220 RepID=A0A7J7IBU2_9RHOD|nr:hypothetical protein F1559_001909 [Cyanidiococcus yangmingshanensis]